MAACNERAVPGCKRVDGTVDSRAKRFPHDSVPPGDTARLGTVSAGEAAAGHKRTLVHKERVHVAVHA
jgi:hypothetical protein